MIMNIETLRLMNFNKYSSHDIFNDKIVIESINLQNSLKNLLLYVDLIDLDRYMDDQDLTQWQNTIELTLKKEHFHKLENVIILLNILNGDIDAIFKMLKENVQLLKYQFKQCTIGLNVDYINEYFYHAHVLEWNKNIDKNYLDQFKELCYQKNEQQEIQDQMNKKFRLLKKKWSS